MEKHCGSLHQSLLIKSSHWLGRANTWAWASSVPSSSLPPASTSPGQSACQLHGEGCQLPLWVTPCGTEDGSDEGDTSSSSSQQVLVFLMDSSGPNFPFQLPVWHNHSELGLILEAKATDYTACCPSSHSYGRSSSSSILFIDFCGHSLADTASAVCDGLTSAQLPEWCWVCTILERIEEIATQLIFCLQWFP